MFTTQSHHISTDLVRDLDEQLSRLNAVAHVSSDLGDTPVLVAISRDLIEPLPLDHPPIDSFVEAELIAARVNALQGSGDRYRITILRSMSDKGGATDAAI